MKASSNSGRAGQIRSRSKAPPLPPTNLSTRRATVRIITASEFGTPDVLRVAERPVPKPRPDEVVVEVKAAGLNLTDTYLRRGMIESAPLPLIFGLDGAGVVVAVGEESTVNVGDRVAWERVSGSYAENVAVPNESVIPLPPDVTFEAA